jgi:hypothetical protein
VAATVEEHRYYDAKRRCDLSASVNACGVITALCAAFPAAPVGKVSATTIESFEGCEHSNSRWDCPGKRRDDESMKKSHCKTSVRIFDAIAASSG